MPTPTFVAERFQLTIADPVLEMLDQEAKLAGMERAGFVRALVGRAMGKIRLERGEDAPPRDPIPVPRRKKPTKSGKAPGTTRMKTTKIVVGFPADQCSWLRETAWRLGALPYSYLLTHLILAWCEVNPLIGSTTPSQASSTE